MPIKSKSSHIVEPEVGFSPKPARRSKFVCAGETHTTVTPTTAAGGSGMGYRGRLHRKVTSRKVVKHLTGSGRR